MEDNKKLKEYIKNSAYGKYFCQFLVIAAGICLFFVLYRFDSISLAFNKIVHILQPIIIGLVFAYLINPVVRYWERKFLKLFSKMDKNKKVIRKPGVVSRGLGITIALFMTISIIIGLILIVVPELVNSITGLIKDAPANLDQFNIWIEGIMTEYGIDNEGISSAIYDLTEYIKKWLTTDFTELINKIAVPLTSGIVNFLGVLFDCLIGIIVSVYVLAGKERFSRMFKKMFYAFFSREKADGIIESFRMSDRVFGGFISGKIIDSLIIGLVCFIFMNIADMPYIVIVSVIVGVTNVIPFFGPYIGGVPSVILILIVNPLKGVYFIIFIIILQQFDGNILGPKILGETTGLTAFWVVFAIILGGGLFGMLGLLAGVPAFAVIYGFVKESVDKRLYEKGIRAEDFK